MVSAWFTENESHWFPARPLEDLHQIVETKRFHVEGNFVLGIELVPGWNADPFVTLPCKEVEWPAGLALGGARRAWQKPSERYPRDASDAETQDSRRRVPPG